MAGKVSAVLSGWVLVKWYSAEIVVKVSGVEEPWEDACCPERT